MHNLREQLAELCHQQKIRTIKYLFSECNINKNGDITIPVEFFEHCNKQIKTPYSELSVNEQNSNREETDKFLELFNRTPIYRLKACRSNH